MYSEVIKLFRSATYKKLWRSEGTNTNVRLHFHSKPRLPFTETWGTDEGTLWY